MIKIKQIEGYESYSITKEGKVINTKTNKELKQFMSSNGYLKVALRNNNQTKQFRIHRLVAKHFIPNPNNYKIVNHKDGNKLNNDINNLEWCTARYNNEHAILNGLRNTRVLTKNEVIYIFSNFKPNSNDFSLKELARKFEVSESTIERIVYCVVYKED